MGEEVTSESNETDVKLLDTHHSLPAAKGHLILQLSQHGGKNQRRYFRLSNGVLRCMETSNSTVSLFKVVLQEGILDFTVSEPYVITWTAPDKGDGKTLELNLECLERNVFDLWLRALNHSTNWTFSMYYTKTNHIVKNDGFLMQETVLRKGTNQLYTVRKYDISEMKFRGQKQVRRDFDVSVENGLNSRAVKCIDFFEENHRLIMVYQHMQGTLKRLLSVKKTLSESYVRRVIYEVLLAVSHLHERNIAHCDITKHSIWLGKQADERTVVRLSDFYYAAIFDQEHHNLVKPEFNQKHQMYFAPEIEKAMDLSKNGSPKSTFSNKVDIWAVACLTFELLTGSRPDINLSNPDENPTVEILFDEQVFEDGTSWDELTDECRNFLTLTLNFDVNARPTAKMALAHDWFADIHAESSDEETDSN